MTWTAAPWALDGARSPASLARLASRAAVKQSGIINPGDLKVTAQSPAANGVSISTGGGVIENRYTTSSQAYVVENLDAELVSFVGLSVAAQVTAKQHLVCVTIGDPQYTTVGHPWLTDGNKPSSPEAALDFQYVRTFVIQNVPAGTMRVEDLPTPPPYPCYALARLEVPANSATITSGMIKDLREVVNPRERTVQWNVDAADDDLLNTAAGVFEYWPNSSNSAVYIPAWATVAYANGYIEGFRQNAATTVRASMKIGSTGQSLYTATSKYNDATTGRKSINVSDKLLIPSGIRGTTQNFQMLAAPSEAGSVSKLTTDLWTTAMVSLRFVEEAV